MKMHVEESKDYGVTWRPLTVGGMQFSFTSRKAAKTWFEALEAANTVEWRTGFLLQCGDGTRFRLVHSRNSVMVSFVRH